MLIAVLLIGIAYWQMIYPKVKKTKQLSNEVENIKTELVKQGQYLKQKELNKSKYPQLLKQLKNSQENALTLNQRDRLITDINSIVNDDIKIENTSTLEMVDKSLQDYIIYPTRIKLDGDYKGIIQFIEEINQLNYLVRIQRLNISHNKKNRNTDLSKFKPLDLQMKIFNYIQRPEKVELRKGE